jgi:hypothetical protein
MAKIDDGSWRCEVIAVACPEDAIADEGQDHITADTEDQHCPDSHLLVFTLTGGDIHSPVAVD